MKTNLLPSAAALAVLALLPLSGWAQEAFQDLRTDALTQPNPAAASTPATPIDPPGTMPEQPLPPSRAPMLPFGGTSPASQSIPTSPDANPNPAPASDLVPGKPDAVQSPQVGDDNPSVEEQNFAD